MTLPRIRARLRTVVAVLGAVPLAALSAAVAPATAGAAGITRDIARSGSAALVPTPQGVDGVSSPEIFAAQEEDQAAPSGFQVTAPAQGGGQPVPAATLVSSFNGINHRQHRLANGGNQFSVEPPDQGLCAGNGFVMESVNDALAVYDASGNALKGVTDLNTFYGYPPAILRTASPPVFGPFVTDPSCLYDQASQRWFQVVLTLDTFPSNGAFTGTNHLDVAVSNTSSPLGGWSVFRVDATDDGTNGTPDHGCSTGPHDPRVTHPNACIGDFPHIGADRNGFFVTTNEYSLFGPEFHSANAYAFSKRALTSGAASVKVTQLDTVGAVRVGDQREAGFTLWPAVAPDQGSTDRARGTELFLSSDAASEVNATGHSDRLVSWALSNTRSLDGTPDLRLVNTVSAVSPYTVPNRSEQKPGSVPLADCINDTTRPTPAGAGCWRLLLTAEPAHDEVEASLDSSDSRMMQVTFANGLLWGALDTELTVQGSPQAAIEWFAVRPEVSDAGGLRVEVVTNRYLSLPGNNLTYPAIGMTRSGRGVIAFTVLGRDHFPSAGYATIDRSGTGDVQVAAEGLGPQDGFSGYKAFNNPPRPRWGDYGAAVAFGNEVWIASEYSGQTCDLATYANLAAFGSCGGTRTALANWYTRISHLTV
jgi:hypothetical protein